MPLRCVNVLAAQLAGIPIVSAAGCPSVQLSQCQQQFPLGKVVSLVELQQPRRRAPDIGHAGDARTGPPEVILPSILPRMKQPGQFPGVRIDAREIRSLDRVASAAGQRQVLPVVRPSVLLRDDVLDVERRLLLVLLPQPAILCRGRQYSQRFPARCLTLRRTSASMRYPADRFRNRRACSLSMEMSFPA